MIQENLQKNLEAVYPLSPMQQGMLFHSLYTPESDIYIVQWGCILSGPLDVEAFKQSWQRIIGRHAILRTAIAWQELDEPLQVVNRRVELPWEQHDWRQLKPEIQQEHLQDFLKADQAHSFDLSQAPLMRLVLIRTTDETHHFIWSFQHLLLDGWSCSLVLKEVLTYYEALSQGRDISIEQGRPYRDYIAWLQQQDLAEAETFWRKTLKGFILPTSLGWERSSRDRSSQETGYAMQRLNISQATSSALYALARQLHVTLNTLAQGAWALLLSRYSGDEDVVFGATVSGRPAELLGVESMVGLFINTLPVRMQVAAQLPCHVWLKQIQAQQFEARQYEYTPLVQIQQWSEVVKGQPLFKSLLVFENYPIDALLQESDKHLQIKNGHFSERSNYPLTLAIQPGQQLSLQMIYDCSYFSDDAIRHMLGHLQQVLEELLAHPQQSLGQVDVLPPAERQRLLTQWHTVSAPPLPEATVPTLFAAQAVQTPEAVALVCGETQLTYRQLQQRATSLAHTLRQRGVVPEQVVGLYAPRSLDLVIGLLAILQAGGAYLPLDVASPPARLARLLQQAGVSLLLAPSSLRDRLPSGLWQILCLDSDLPAAPVAAAELDCPAQPGHLAYVMYTSGSTGEPKGVCVTHRNIVRLLAHPSYAQVDRQQVVLHLASISFDATTFEVWAPLLHGGRLVLAPSEQVSLHDLASLLREQAITLLWLTAGLFQQVVEQEAEALAEVGQVLTGGDVLPVGQVQQVLERWPMCELINGYGPTECTTFSCTARVRELWREGEAVPIGKPIGHTQVYVVDEQWQLVGVGMPGELLIGGEGVARGYLGHGEWTAERFVPDVWSGEPGARVYRTGDLVRWREDGVLEFLGRMDQQVKIRGFRVEPAEIETVLCQNPAISEAAVIACEDISGEKYLAAYLVAAPGQQVEQSELRAYLHQKVPEYLIPAIFIALPAFPLTPNGKIDRRALPTPERTSFQQIEAYQAPRTPFEEILVEIWTDVLKLDRIGIHQNFFEIGGHSLRATQVISRIRNVFQIDFPLRILFESPTIAQLAAQIEIASCAEQKISPLQFQAISREDALPLSFAQERLWFLDQWEPESPLYNIPIALCLKGELRVEGLEYSFNQIIQRHEALRTIFKTVDGQPLQIILPVQELHLQVIDIHYLTKQTKTSVEQHIANLALLEAEKPFDLAQGPLLRAVLLHLSDEEHVLLLTQHHIISDGWSISIFVHELTTFYTAFLTGSPVTLKPLPVQYADYAIWQRHWMQGEVLEQQLDYWRRQLAGAPLLLQLPVDHPRSALRSYKGVTHPFTISTELSASLKALCRETNTTLFMVLLAAFQVLLSRWSGQEDFLLGTPVANRTRSEFEGLIGFFVNTLVLRACLQDDPTVLELLSQVQDQALGAFTHQDVPFEYLVEAMQVERDTTSTPFFQVMFVLQNAPQETLRLPNLVLSTIESKITTAKFDLTLDMMETAEGLSGAFEYSTDLFEQATIERMSGHFEQLLRAFVSNPTQRIADIALLTAQERDLVLDSWNATAQMYPEDQCIQQLFEAQAKRTPDAVAIAGESQQLTYATLNARANQLAHYLRLQGVGPEVLVGICLDRSVDLLVALLGVLKAGGAYVPLNPHYPLERLTFMLQDARIQVVLTQKELREKLPSLSLLAICLDESENILTEQPIENPLLDINAKHLAYVIYTSGSTGIPKGVLTPHKAVINHSFACIDLFKLRPSDRVLQFASISFDAAAEEIFPAWLSGAAVVVPPFQGVPALADFSQLIETEQLTILDLPTAYWYTWTMELATLKKGLSDTVRLVIVGGEEALPNHLKLWQQVGSQVEWANTYGPTETTIISTAYRLAPRSRYQEMEHIPIGRPIANTRLYVLNQRLQSVPIGAPGELYIGGAGVARGYLQRPELTAERFLPDPFSQEPGARLYKTGDLARYMPTGDLEYLGRIDHQVKVRGFRVEPGEVEKVLLQHPHIDECIIQPYEDTPGDRRLVAYVVSRQEAAPVGSELRSFLQEYLPDYMLPSAFVMLPALPLTTNGKIDHRALPAPERSHFQQEAFVAPRNLLEHRLELIWEELLNIQPISVTDNFFTLGGNSLLAVRLVAHIQKQFEQKVPLPVLFQNATIERLAAFLRQEGGSHLLTPLVALQPRGSKKPFFCVHPGSGNVFSYRSLAEHLGQDQPFYGLQDVSIHEGSSVVPDIPISEMAASYVEAVQSVQPEGPYLLGGYSFGGIVAFEMAQQLLQQGHGVALLAILDGGAPTLDDNTYIEGDDASILAIIAQELTRYVERRNVQELYRELCQLKPQDQVNYVVGFMKQAKLELAGSERDWVEQQVNVFKARARATQRYTAKRYSEVITLFRSSASDLELAEDLGWEVLSSHPIEIHVVPGHHDTLMSEPNVRELAESLRACLNQAQASYMKSV